MISSLDRARRLAALGLSVIPVPAPRPGIAPDAPGGGKVPAISWREYQTWLPTEAELRDWLTEDPHANLAVIAGRVSGVVVIDADSSDATAWLTRSLPYTPWQTQTARGFHLWYRHPGGHVANRARIATRDGRLAIDVRGDGGYVIAPGSVHASGAHYFEAGDWTEPRERVPVFSPGWLARPPRPSASPPRLYPRMADVLDRARRYLAAIPRPEIGCGSDVLTFSAACRLVRGFELSPAEATALLWEWAGHQDGWTYEWVARKVAHAMRYGSEAIGVLR